MAQPPVRQQNRLGTLQVGVAGHHRFLRGFGLLHQNRLQFLQGCK